MRLVVDASIAAAWALPDESSPVADAALSSTVDSGASAPVVFVYEFRNLLLSNERRARIGPVEVEAALLRMADLDVEIDAAGDPDDVLALARRTGLTVYDAAYLELALRRDLPLATLDRRLADAATAAGARLFGTPA
jgi:predicted nucleic acid-binding protein